jgi:uncharacterized membrane protein (DUF485 family)
MSTDVSPPGAATPIDGDRYVAVQQTDEFAGLRRALRSFVFPMTVAFLAWYLLYVLLSAFARDFMGTKVIGNINIAFIFGVLQFVSTFVIAIVYSRYAERKLDPIADRIRDELVGPPAGGPAGGPASGGSVPEGPAAGDRGGRA